MAMDKQNIAKDIESAVHFEEELQLSAKENGIRVVDLYSTTWGYCRAISATFRRLYFDTDESLKLKFLTVDASAVLAELERTEKGETDNLPRRDFPRPKNLDGLKDTLPAAWRPYLVKQNGKSKPRFLFFKDGKFIKEIEGVDTPTICQLIQDMTTVKTPADEVITNNQGLLDLWCEYFNPLESETHWDKFHLAVNAVCKITAPLSEEEVGVMQQTLEVGQDKTVKADSVAKWVGTQTLMQAFTSLLPNYEERAIQARLDQEAAEIAKAKAEKEGGEAEAEAERE